MASQRVDDNASFEPFFSVVRMCNLFMAFKSFNTSVSSRSLLSWTCKFFLFSEAGGGSFGRRRIV